MGIQETASKKRRRKNQIRDVVLHTVAAAGLIGVALVAPNAIQYMDSLNLPLSGRQDDLIKRATKRMVKNGLLEWKLGKLRLTARGQEAYVLMKHAHLKEKKRKWDGRWRLFIFDVPEKRRPIRTRVREILRLLGCVRVQDSVWAYPYDCEDLIVLLKADLKIGRALLYAIVDSLENDIVLRTHFKLPLG
jgi:DNA-binding transcriptional regulator PaaX